MSTKAAEKEFYKTIYLLTFGRESHYFYLNDSDTIYGFLKDIFWGEDLQLRINLLSKLLYYDSLVNPQLCSGLKLKSKRIKQYGNHTPR